MIVMGRWSEGRCCSALQVVVSESDGEQNVMSGDVVLLSAR